MEPLHEAGIEANEAATRTPVRKRVAWVVAIGVVVASAVGVWVARHRGADKTVATDAAGEAPTKAAQATEATKGWRPDPLDVTATTPVDARGPSGRPGDPGRTPPGVPRRDPLADATVVVFGGARYVCEPVRGEYMPCVRYLGGEPPPVIFNGDIWCRWPTGTVCVEYDPSKYFEITSEGIRYLCKESWLSSFNHFECSRYYGGKPLITLGSPDLYCSGSKAFPECSELWYPDELKRYDISTINGETYVCRSARSFYASSGDKDCARYHGGDPDSVSWAGSLKCSPSRFGGSYECRSDYYPSEEEGVVFMKIDYQEYACKEAVRGYECYRYYGGSPKQAMMGGPDYYCNNYGCSRSGYPSPY